MTLKEFIDKYTGKYVEYHSFSSGSLNQCVDCANQYIVEVLGLTPIIGTNAQDFPSKAVGFDVVLNTPTGVPSPGDLVIFKSADNVGHISIFVSGNASLFTSFDQNYPTGSPCKLVSHNYRNVISWLHPKENMSGLPSNYGDIIHNSTQWEEVCKNLELGEARSTVAQQVVNTIGGYKSRITTLEREVGENQAELDNRIEQVSRLKGEIAKSEDRYKLATDQLILTTAQLNEMAKAKGEINIQLEQANKTIETLKQQATNGTITLTLKEILTLIWNQKITIERK